MCVWYGTSKSTHGASFLKYIKYSSNLNNGKDNG